MIKPEQFARTLVERLGPVLPAGFTVRADGDVVRIEGGEGLGASASLALLDPEEAEPQDYADAAWNVLSMAQDVVSETAAEPWPAPMGSADDIPEPGTRVEGLTIHLYFGPDEQPVLLLSPIDLGQEGGT